MNEPHESSILSVRGETAWSGEAGYDLRDVTVIQVLPSLVTGGVERGAVDIAEAIVAAGGRAVVVSAGGPMERELRRAGAEHVKLPVDSKNPFVIRANIKLLEKLIDEHAADIVHARSRAPAWSAFYAAKRKKCHFVTTFHGTYSHGNALKRAYNAIMTRGERVIAISGFVAGHIRQVYGVPPSKIRVIPRGVDIARFDPASVSQERIIDLATRWRLPDGVPVITLPGRLTRWKGQTVFIDAIEKLGRRDVRCLLVGSDQGRDDYRQELQTMIDQRGLGDIVHVVDHCDDMPAAYMLTDVLVSASTEPEAFGRVIVEAGAMGRPVIATDHGGAQETVIEGETGWLVPPSSPEKLAEAINEVLALDGDARERLAELAITHVRENFSKEAMSARTLAVYREVLDSPVPEA